MKPRILTPQLSLFASAEGIVPIANPEGSEATECLVFESRSERVCVEKIPSDGTVTKTAVVAA